MKNDVLYSKSSCSGPQSRMVYLDSSTGVSRLRDIYWRRLCGGVSWLVKFEGHGLGGPQMETKNAGTTMTNIFFCFGYIGGAWVYSHPVVVLVMVCSFGLFFFSAAGTVPFFFLDSALPRQGRSPGSCSHFQAKVVLVHHMTRSPSMVVKM